MGELDAVFALWTTVVENGAGIVVRAMILPFSLPSCVAIMFRWAVSRPHSNHNADAVAAAVVGRLGRSSAGRFLLRRSWIR